MFSGTPIGWPLKGGAHPHARTSHTSVWSAPRLLTVRQRTQSMSSIARPVVNAHTCGSTPMPARNTFINGLRMRAMLVDAKRPFMKNRPTPTNSAVQTVVVAQELADEFMVLPQLVQRVERAMSGFGLYQRAGVRLRPDRYSVHRVRYGVGSESTASRALWVGLPAVRTLASGHRAQRPGWSWRPFAALA